MSQNLTSKAINGVKWTTLSTIATSLMQIGYTAVMARLLDPAAFGLVAMSGIIIRFGGFFANMGLGQALIQKKELFEEDIRATFTFSSILSTIVLALIWLLAPFSTIIFDNKDLIPVIRVMAFSFLIGGLSSTASSLLKRQMNFKVMAISEISSYVLAYGGVGITLAYFNFGVWSLVYASLSQYLILGIIYYTVIRHNVYFIFNWKYYKPLFAYGSRASVVQFLEFINGNSDTILIGHFLGSARLGIYNRAYNLLYLPVYFLTTSLARVVFPSFSQLQSDLSRLAKVYLSSITLIAALVIPACMGIGVAAREIVLIMLGEKFIESIPILQILCIAIPLSMITMFAGIVCDATANLNKKVILNIIFIITIYTLFFLLKSFGLQGFAAVIAIGEIIRTFMYMFVIRKVLEINYIQIIKCYFPGVINGFIIGLAIFTATYFLRSIDSPLLVIFSCQLLTGLILQTVLMFLFPHRILKSEIQRYITKLDFSKSRFYESILLPYLNFLNKKV